MFHGSVLSCCFGGEEEARPAFESFRVMTLLTHSRGIDHGLVRASELIEQPLEIALEHAARSGDRRRRSKQHVGRVDRNAERAARSFLPMKCGGTRWGSRSRDR